MGELNRITNDIRSTIFALRSGQLETRDAEAIVLAVADELQAHTLVKLDVSSDGLPGRACALTRRRSCITSSPRRSATCSATRTRRR